MDVDARIVFGVLLAEDEQPTDFTEEVERVIKECGARFEYAGDATAGSVHVILASGPFFEAECPGVSATVFELPSIEEVWVRSVLGAALYLGARSLTPKWLLLVSAS